MTLTTNPRAALSRLNLRDSYVMQETADIYIANLQQFANTDPAQSEALEVASMQAIEQQYGFSGGARNEDSKPFVYQDGIAIIPVHGSLLNRFGGCWGFITGYSYIRRMMNAALEDDDVQLIVYDHDSPGGEAAGNLELAEEIRESREIKPSIAVVDSLACSASYALASAATRMVATPSSKIGSIGVYRMHINLQGAMKQAGVEITFIEAPEGGMKTAGHPYAPLSDEAKKHAQEQVNAAYQEFAELVAENRDMDQAEVDATRAKVFRADEALALRLIDAVQTPSEAVSTFVAELANEDPNQEDDEMTTKQTATDKGAAPANAPEVASGLTNTDVANAVATALREDRERQAAIKALPEAAERPKLADHLALSGVTVEQAKATLAVAGVETAAAPNAAEPKPGEKVDDKNHLAEAMDKTKNPDVGAGAEQAGQPGGEDEKTPDKLAAAILADQGAMTGRNYGLPASA